MFNFSRYIQKFTKFKYRNFGKNEEIAKAIQFYPREKHLEIIEKTIPQHLEPKTVLIKTTYAGISGTDLKIIDGQYPLISCNKIILGHEICGVVAKNAGDFQIGDKVVINPAHSCQVCEHCRDKNENFCPHFENKHLGISQDGGWQNYCAIPMQQLYKLPENMKLADGILVHSVSCVSHAWKLFKPIEHGRNILLLGAGFIGNLFAAFFHFNGYKNVTVCEENIRKLNITAKLHTCYDLITPDVLIAEKSEELFDVIVDCSGNSKAIEMAVKFLNYGGTFCIFGITDSEMEIKLSPHEVYRKELCIFSPKLNPFSYPNAFSIIEAMNSRYLTYEKLGIKLFELCEYKQALECLQCGTISKAVFCLDSENTQM